VERQRPDIKHTGEPKTVTSIHNIDVMLISETHFTEKGYPKLPKCTVYHTNHPARTDKSNKKNSIKHHQLNNYSQDLQATSVSIEESLGLLTISAVYLPSKYIVKQNRLEDFYNTLERRFIEGDYSA
jgi:hypothetical protein